MHADFLGLTVPRDHGDEVFGHVTDQVTLLGGYALTDDLLVLGEGGKIKLYDRHQVSVVSLTGVALATLRAFNMLEGFLFPIAEGPHKITRLHIAHDLQEPSRPHLRQMLRKGRSGALKLSPASRRPLKPENATYYDRHCYYDPGKPTGSVYLGGEKAEIRIVGYDKRNERIDRGFPDPGYDWFRVELRITDKMRPTMRDVVLPEPCFWHYAQSVLDRPSDIPEWTGMAEQYRLQRPPEALPHELMRRRIENSPDVDHLLSLADRIGANGFQALVSLLEQKSKRSSIQQADSDEAA